MDDGVKGGWVRAREVEGYERPEGPATVFLRVLDVERVTLDPLPGGGQRWQVLLQVGQQRFRVGDDFPAHGQALQQAEAIMSAADALREAHLTL